jgi:hypothetical protein
MNKEFIESIRDAYENTSDGEWSVVEDCGEWEVRADDMGSIYTPICEHMPREADANFIVTAYDNISMLCDLADAALEMFDLIEAIKAFAPEQATHIHSLCDDALAKKAALQC